MGGSRIAAQHRPFAGERRRRVLNEEPLIAALQRHTPKREVVQQLGALELMAEGNGSLAFALISGHLGIDHRIQVAQSAASGNGPNYPDLEVDGEAVLELARQP